MEETRKYVEGIGSIFRKRFKRKRSDGSEYEYVSPTYEIAYYHNGAELRESSHSSDEKAAIRLLKKRVLELGRGIVAVHEERITFEALMEDLKNDYISNKKRSLESIALSVAHLEKFFGNDRALHITTDRIRAYIVKRQEQGAANASINRELSALGRAFMLAQQAGKLFHKPHIPKLAEDNARQGFLEHGDFLRLREELPEYLRDPVSFLELSGWRSGEMKSLEWRDVAADAIRLRVENSKSKKQRILPLRGELTEIIERARQNRRADCPYVFHSDGEPIGDFRKSWWAACCSAGLGRMVEVERNGKKENQYVGLLVHDLRRSAIRNMVRSGVREKIAMELSGHRTRSVFDRYNITDEDDLAAASERISGYLQQQAEAAKIVPLRKVS